MLSLLRRVLAVGLTVVGLLMPLVAQGADQDRQWTVYLAQDKHLDYNWCGSTTELELRMAALVDYYLDATRDRGVRWNLDCTLWDEVYRRHRGDAGTARLREAIREGRIGYGGNYAVLLWGIFDTETAIRACYGAAPIEQSTGVEARTALIMENPGLTWGAANVLTECGFNFLGRGVYHLRAESYNRQREPYLQAPEHAFALPGLKALDIDFPGGPLLAFKVADDNRRLILRFWNVTEETVRGSFGLPDGWNRAESCDALERHQKALKPLGGRVQFDATPRGITTVAIYQFKPHRPEK